MIRNVVMVKLSSDLDEEHNRLRAELAPYSEQTARLQFELPDG